MSAPCHSSSPSPLDRAQIAARIPHAGNMCLLERLERWDDDTVQCSAISHRDLDNPLRSGDRLPVSAGIEYAAQAMALHGSLTAGAGRPRPGVVAAVQQVEWRVARLDLIAAELTVVAQRDSVSSGGGLYRFSVSAGDELLLQGRALIAFAVQPA